LSSDTEFWQLTGSALRGKTGTAIQYVYLRYGELGAAMCANVITFRGKSASRETGKALGLARETLNHLSGMVGSLRVERAERHTERKLPRNGPES
jgi:error-prone DNA polymerase